MLTLDQISACTHLRQLQLIACVTPQLFSTKQPVLYPEGAVTLRLGRIWWQLSDLVSSHVGIVVHEARQLRCWSKGSCLYCHQ